MREGKGVSVGMSVKVGCTVGTGIVAVGVSVMITTVAVGASATTGVVALGPKLHAARRRVRKRMSNFFI
jgi:hypothetical protein